MSCLRPRKLWNAIDRAGRCHRDSFFPRPVFALKKRILDIDTAHECEPGLGTRAGDSSPIAAETPAASEANARLQALRREVPNMKRAYCDECFSAVERERRAG